MKQLALVLALAGTCVLGSTVAATPASALETYEAKMAASDNGRISASFRSFGRMAKATPMTSGEMLTNSPSRITRGAFLRTSTWTSVESMSKSAGYNAGREQS